MVQWEVSGPGPPLVVQPWGSYPPSDPHVQWEGLGCPFGPFQLYNSVIARVMTSYLPSSALGVTPRPDSWAVGFKKAWLWCHRKQGLIH